MSRARCKVLYLQSHLTIGGHQRQVSDLIDALDRDRFEPVVCCIRELGEFGVRLRASGVRAYSGLLRSEYDVGVVLKVARLIRQEAIDIVHNTGANRTYVVGYLAAVIAGRGRIAIAIHSTNMPGGRNVTTPLGRWAIRRADRVVMVAHAQKRVVCAREGINPDRVTVIHNGVPLSRLRRGQPATRQDLGIQDRSAMIVAIVARLDPEKDHRSFLGAARLVAARVKSAHFLVVGDGPERLKLESVSSAYGLDGRVHFLGTQPDICRILPTIDVGVLTSSTETMPLSIQEMMGLGKPVVVTDVGGVREMIDDGVDGFVVPPGNAVATADRVTQLLLDPRGAGAIGARGRMRIEKQFTATRMARAYEKLYLEMLEQPKQPPRRRLSAMRSSDEVLIDEAHTA